MQKSRTENPNCLQTKACWNLHKGGATARLLGSFGNINIATTFCEVSAHIHDLLLELKSEASEAVKLAVLHEGLASSHLAFILIGRGLVLTGCLALVRIFRVHNVEEVLICSFNCNLICDDSLQFYTCSDALPC